MQNMAVYVMPFNNIKWVQSRLSIVWVFYTASFLVLLQPLLSKIQHLSQLPQEYSRCYREIATDLMKLLWNCLLKLLII